MEQNKVNIGVKKIKDIEFSVNEAITLENPDEIALGFELTINFKLEDHTVEMVLTAFFSDKPEGDVFMKIKTSNVFLLLELADFQKSDKKGFDIPDNLLVTLLSVSISHTRALLAKNALGTIFADIYIPIVNPVEVFKQLHIKE